MSRQKMEVGELFLVLDMVKRKKMPGTKNKPIYKGPFVISSITDSHLLTKKGEKVTKYPIHLTRIYFPRVGEVSDHANNLPYDSEFIYLSDIRMSRVATWTDQSNSLKVHTHQLE